MNLPAEISEFIEGRENDGESPCLACNSSCCNGPGFAILENVTMIYELYMNDKLTRSDYIFEKGLSFCCFVFKYFDITVINDKLLVFFPKMISDKDRLITVPPWNFWQSRDYIIKREKSYGCIFLKKKQLENDTSPNYCLLHNGSTNELSEKPIDCLFLQCSEVKKIKNPTGDESRDWFDLLDKHFPNSKERFNLLCPKLGD